MVASQIDRLERILAVVHRLVGGLSNFLQWRTCATARVPERQQIDGIAFSFVLVVEVVPNSDQEQPSDADEPRMGHRLSDRRQ